MVFKIWLSVIAIPPKSWEAPAGDAAAHMTAGRRQRYHSAETRVKPADLALKCLTVTGTKFPLRVRARTNGGSLFRIDQCAFRSLAGGRRQFRGLDLSRAQNVEHGLARRNQIIGNDAPMTAPPNSFGAHDCDALVLAASSQPLQSGSERFGPGIIGVIAKAVVLPKVVGGIGRAAAPAAELGKMLVCDAVPSELGRQRVEVELRIGPGARDGPHIRQQSCAGALQQGDEVGDRAGRMTDGKIGGHGASIPGRTTKAGRWQRRSKGRRPCGLFPVEFLSSGLQNPFSVPRFTSTHFPCTDAKCPLR